MRCGFKSAWHTATACGPQEKKLNPGKAEHELTVKWMPEWFLVSLLDGTVRLDIGEIAERDSAELSLVCRTRIAAFPETKFRRCRLDWQ